MLLAVKMRPLSLLEIVVKNNESHISVANLVFLTGLTLFALAAIGGAGLGLVTNRTVQWFGAGLLGLAVAQLTYGFAAVRLAGKGVQRRAACRYALALQGQALMELLYAGLCCVFAWLGVYVLMAALGDSGAQQELRFFFTSPVAAFSATWFGASMPALSILMGAWRMHALSRTPQALAGAIDGRLLRKSLVLPADAADARHALVRRLERLTDKSMPALGRIWYGSHPRLAIRDLQGETVYELVWWQCPMKMCVALRQLADGSQELTARCVLRGGLYRFELCATPADALAQMQYIDAHLLAPLGAELAMVSAERQRDALREQALAAQLRILQAQIEPHFLFNTLANVRQLYRSSVASGEDMLNHLIAYLQSAMADLRAEESSVGKEMDLAMNYLSIMKIRMGERLAYSFVLPDALLRHRFPPAMLISLVENAIKHGLAGRDGGEIVLSAQQTGGQLRVAVTDNGAGFSSVGGTGVGLSNIRQRLEAMYGTRAWLEVGAPEEGGFSATIVIPADEGK